MITKLGFGPVSQTPVDLLAVVLDDEKTLHEIDDVQVAAHVQRAAATFRDKTLKREYYATLEGVEGGEGPRRLLEPAAQELEPLGEREDLHRARAAPGPRLPAAPGGPGAEHREAAPLVGKAVEGAVLGAYAFDRYRQEKDDFFAKDASLTILAHPDHQADAEARRARYAWVSENVNRARDLTNEPGAAVTPETIANEAGEIAREVDLEVEVLDPAALKARGYQGIVRVGAGSAHPGRMVVLRHVPRKPSKETLALVGKGITFDSGGISLKPGDKMWEMKGDMAGAAAVLYAMRAIGKIRPDAQGGRRPVLRGEPARRQRPAARRRLHGQERQVGHGRQHRRRGAAGADRRPRPRRRGGGHPLVDIATLTGAVVRALGPSVAGVMGTDPDLVRRVIRSGEHHGESFWELPLVEEYKESLKTPFADVNNIAAGGLAGAITAGLFLREFVPAGVAWAHLDIAGPMFRDKEWKYYDAGALGFGVKTLVDLCERFRDPVA